jgi:hypothetical protein
VLVLLGATGTFFVPAFLWIAHFRRTVWNNSARVIDWLTTLRAPLLGGFVAYGAASVLLRFCDDFVSRFGFQSAFAQEPGIAWPGFTWLLPAIFVLSAGFVHLRLRYSRGTSSLLRRYLLGAPLHLFTFLLSVLLLWVGIAWRSADVQAKTAELEAKRTSELKAALAAAPAEEAKKPEPSPEQKSNAKAPDGELAKASLEGIDGLLPLSEKYPNDPDVLEPLIHAFAARLQTLGDAMLATKRLLKLAPEKSQDDKLRIIVRKAATIPGEASKEAFELLADNFGSAGADILFDLSVHVPKQKAKAEALLDTPSVKGSATPALAIAMDLRKLHTSRPPTACSELPALLERATALGDGRAAEALFAIASPRPSPLCPALSKQVLTLASTLAQKAKSQKR